MGACWSRPSRRSPTKSLRRRIWWAARPMRRAHWCWCAACTFALGAAGQRVLSQAQRGPVRVKVVALSGWRRRRSLPRRAGPRRRVADGHRRHRRRLRTPRAERLPDLDTVMYTLSALSDEERGWGLKDESFRALESVRVRRRRLVRPRRSRPRDAPGSHRSASSRAVAHAGDDAAVRCAGDLRARPADGRWSVPNDDRHARGNSAVSRLVRTAARSAGGPEGALRGPPPPAPGVLEALAECELVLNRPVEPVRVDRPDLVARRRPPRPCRKKWSSR